jgi:hypothetical protein
MALVSGHHQRAVRSGQLLVAARRRPALVPPPLAFSTPDFIPQPSPQLLTAGCVSRLPRQPVPVVLVMQDGGVAHPSTHGVQEQGQVIGRPSAALAWRPV